LRIKQKSILKCCCGSPLRCRLSTFPEIETALSALENEPPEAHVRGMEKYRSGMLEVSVTHQPPQWEWQVTFNGEMVANGFEREQIAARFEGNNAMFLLLAAGWNP
jgi:hypothetical protein